MTETVYLDNAATTYPKPVSVERAFLSAAKEAYGNAGRSSHPPAVLAAERLYECRSAIADAFGGFPERVVFTENATHGLNLIIKALTPSGGHLLLSDIEHNATLRPTVALGEHGVSYSLFRTSADLHSPDPARDEAALLHSLKASLRPDTVGVIACHRSNCLPIELPLSAIGRFCREHGLFFIVDASQSAGACRIDAEALGITALVAPSHKGLYGYRGAGFVMVSRNVPDETLHTLTEGGSGSDSRSPEMPSLLPERLEAGTRPVEILASLRAGLRFTETVGRERIGEKEVYLSEYLKSRLLALPRIIVHLPKRKSRGTVLFSPLDTDPVSLCAFLSERGVCLREGLHCAPLAHRLIGTEATGALRASFGWFNSESDADALIYALRDRPRQR